MGEFLFSYLVLFSLLLEKVSLEKHERRQRNERTLQKF